jgi:CRP-like cAMP-binding protein
VVRLMEPVDLPVRTELLRGGAADAPVYFPTAGLVSIAAEMSDGAIVECAAVGHEGWLGMALFGGTTPVGTVAFQQIAGSALRMTADAFEAALHDAPVFAASVRRFAGLTLSYAMQTAACNRHHDALARCARWLLFTRERVGQEQLDITLEFVGQMLGASRSAVTATMARLEQQQLIDRSRAHVVIRDVEGLARVACECHGALQQAYGRYLGSLQISS